MIDYRLLASIAAAIAAPALLARAWRLPPWASGMGFVDFATVPALMGTLVGRTVALTLDDPGSLRRVADFFVVRSGVEFWPGAAGAAAVVAYRAWRARDPCLARLAEIIPLAMVGYATFEASCLLRDGCLGPFTSFGLRPAGMTVRMFPVALVMAAAVAVAAAGVRRLEARGTGPLTVVLVSVFAVAVVRSVGSTWLPRIGDGLTRAHRTSIVVAITAAVSLIAALTRAAGRAKVAS